MKYTLVTGNEAYDVAARVNEHLADGWQLQGGISVCAQTSSHIRDGDGEISSALHYTQALVKSK